MNDDEVYDYADEDDPYADEDMFDCALGLDGQCAMAGSEDCDWDCPHSHGPLFAGSNAWHLRHAAGLPVPDCECGECRAARLAAIR